MSMKIVQHVLVQPQIELAVRTIRPPSSTTEGQFAAYIESVANKARHIETPDGWLVPLQDLRDRVKDVADFIYYEALQYGGEVEVAGGFAILTDDGHFLAISASSNFRFATELARTIINLKPDDQEHVLFVDNQELWKVSCMDSSIEIETERIARRRPEYLRLPAKELKEQMEAALAETERFVSDLEQFLLAHEDAHMTSESIRWIFGLNSSSCDD